MYWSAAAVRPQVALQSLPEFPAMLLYPWVAPPHYYLATGHSQAAEAQSRSWRSAVPLLIGLQVEGHGLAGDRLHAACALHTASSGLQNEDNHLHPGRQQPSADGVSVHPLEQKPSPDANQGQTAVECMQVRSVGQLSRVPWQRSGFRSREMANGAWRQVTPLVKTKARHRWSAR